MVGQTKYRTIDDIPDELVPKYSKRDPENQLYRTRQWVNFKKQQILFTQNDGIHGNMRTLPLRIAHYVGWAGAIGLLVSNIYLFNKALNPKK